MPDAPPAPPPPAAEPPAIPQDQLEDSKAIFKKAREDAGLDKPPEPTPPPKPPDEPPTPPDKPKVPADVIAPPKKGEETVPESVLEIRAMVLPKNAKPEQVANFEKLKSKAETDLLAAHSKLTALEKQIADSTSKTELEGLRTKLQETEQKAKDIEERFSKVAFEKSPRFQAMFVSQEQAALEGAKSYLEGTDIKPELIDLAAHTTGKNRLDLLKKAELDPDTIAAILPHLANFDTIQRNKKAALDNWQTESSKWRQEDEQRVEAERTRRAEQENKVWETVLTKTDLLPLRKSKDDENWNARAEEIRNRAKGIYNGEASLDQVAEFVLKGAAYDAQQEVIDHLTERITNLETENAGLKSASPGGTITQPAGGAPTPTAPVSRDEQAKQTFNEQKAAAGA